MPFHNPDRSQLSLSWTQRVISILAAACSTIQTLPLSCCLVVRWQFQMPALLWQSRGVHVLYTGWLASILENLASALKIYGMHTFYVLWSSCLVYTMHYKPLTLSCKCCTNVAQLYLVSTIKSVAICTVFLLSMVMWKIKSIRNFPCLFLCRDMYKHKSYLYSDY